jgi:hypothetical protein
MNLSFYREIDEFLGDKKTRYFGSGYINSTHEIDNFSTSSDSIEKLIFFCTGKVLLPRVWSIKGENEQKPHLSTIDIIELSMLTFNKFIHEIDNKITCAKKLIHKLHITAGKVPIESDFDQIEITGDLKRFSRDLNILNLNISNMSIQIYYQSDISEIKRDDYNSYIKTPLEITDVMINVDELKATALVNNKRILKEHIEPWSISCLFAAGLQLGQILLYRLDLIDRENSNTLWMKRTEIQFLSSTPNIDVSHPIFTRLENVKRYEKQDGDWRRADICSFIGNTKIICSVTHKLPLRS